MDAFTIHRLNVMCRWCGLLNYFEMYALLWFAFFSRSVTGWTEQRKI